MRCQASELEVSIPRVNRGPYDTGGTASAWWRHRRGDDHEVVLRPSNLGLKAGVAEGVQQLIGAADDAVCSIDRGRVGDRSVRFDDIAQHEAAAFGQPLRDT